MLLKLAAATAALPVLMTAGLASLDWMVVDVREGGPQGHRIVVPVPMALARLAVSVAPVAPAPPPELREAAPVAQAALAALTSAPDFDLVRVEQREETVVIRKEGDTLRVEVDSPREHVRVNLPLSAARSVLADAGKGQLRPATILQALNEVDGDLVEVQSGDDHVRVWMW